MSSDAQLATLDGIRAQNGASLQRFLDEGAILRKERKEIETGLATFATKMPGTQRAVYAARLKDIDRQLLERAKLEAVLAAGYSPYVVPRSFSFGFVDHPSNGKIARLGKGGMARVFNAPMPVGQVRKYLAAQAQGVFDEIVIASSDHSLFRDVRVVERPRPTYVDPFMVGLVALPEFWGADFRIGLEGADIAGAQAFLISHWDLSDELSTAVTSRRRNAHGIRGGTRDA